MKVKNKNFNDLGGLFLEEKLKWLVEWKRFFKKLGCFLNRGKISNKMVMGKFLDNLVSFFLYKDYRYNL